MLPFALLFLLQGPFAVVQPPQPPAAEAQAEKPWPPPGVIRAGKDVAHPRLVFEAKPNYTGDAMRNRIEGVLFMEAVVETDGSVGEVRVTRSLDKEYGLDDQAVRAVKRWRFEPATRDGEPVPVLVEIEMSFVIGR